MLIFTLKQNDSLVINDEIVVELVAIDDDVAKLGCLAPREVPVYRKEVYEALRAANERNYDGHVG